MTFLLTLLPLFRYVMDRSLQEDSLNQSVRLSARPPARPSGYRLDTASAVDEFFRRFSSPQSAWTEFGQQSGRDTGENRVILLRNCVI